MKKLLEWWKRREDNFYPWLVVAALGYFAIAKIGDYANERQFLEAAKQILQYRQQRYCPDPEQLPEIIKGETKVRQGV